MFFDPTYLLYIGPAILFVILAQVLVKSTYRKWSQVRTQRGVSGGDAAQQLLQYGGLSSVEIEGTRGTLSDHYDPRSRKLHLSQGVAQGQSVAAMAIAAHEIGHAMQDKEGYGPLRIRSALVPAVSLGSNFGWILILIGLVIGGVFGTQLAWVGVGAFGLGAVFALATLPVELNASARARALLTQSGLIHTAEEERGVNAVLNAAAFTYVAALAAALLQLLYWASLVAGGGRRRR